MTEKTKINSINLNNTTYDIDLPDDANPTIAGLTVAGNTNLNGNLTVTGATTLSSLTVSNSITCLSSINLDEDGDVYLYYDSDSNQLCIRNENPAGVQIDNSLAVGPIETTGLNVTGSTTLSDLVVEGTTDVSTLSATSSTGTSNFSGNIKVSKNLTTSALTVSNNTLINGNLTVSSAASGLTVSGSCISFNSDYLVFNPIETKLTVRDSSDENSPAAEISGGAITITEDDKSSSYFSDHICFSHQGNTDTYTFPPEGGIFALTSQVSYLHNISIAAPFAGAATIGHINVQILTRDPNAMSFTKLYNVLSGTSSSNYMPVSGLIVANDKTVTIPLGIYKLDSYKIGILCQSTTSTGTSGSYIASADVSSFTDIIQ